MMSTPRNALLYSAHPNQTLIAPDRTVHAFDIGPLRKERLVRRIDDIDVTMQYRDAIESFEAKRRAAVAWLPTARRAQNDSA
jgi:3-isopropylmalate/(R)-2-methylmalate dehydratase small subunit